MTADLALIRAWLSAYDAIVALPDDVDYDQRTAALDRIRAIDMQPNALASRFRALLDQHDAGAQRIAALEGALADALPIIVENSSDDYMCDLCRAMLCHGESHKPDCLIARLEALRGTDHD